MLKRLFAVRFFSALLCVTLVTGCQDHAKSPEVSSSEILNSTQSTISGTVRSVDGLPISDVEIIFETSGENGIVRTGANGKYVATFSGSPKRWIIARPRAKGWQVSPNQPQGNLVPGQNESIIWQIPESVENLSFNITMKAAPILHGSVLLNDGVTSAPNTKMMLIYKESHGTPCNWDSVKSAQNGDFHLNLPILDQEGADVYLIAWNEANRQAAVFDSVDHKAINIRLFPEKEYQGVLMSSNGQVIENSKIQLFYKSNLCGVSMDTAEISSGNRGRFTAFAIPGAQIGIRLRTDSGQTLSAFLPSDDWENRTATFIFDERLQELNVTFDSPALHK